MRGAIIGSTYHTRTQGQHAYGLIDVGPEFTSDVNGYPAQESPVSNRHSERIHFLVDQQA